MVKILRSEVWNNRRRCVIERDDGTQVTIKGDPGMTDEEAIAKIPAPAQEVSREKLLSECSDDEIVTELRSRKVSLILEGEVVVCKQK